MSDTWAGVLAISVAVMALVQLAYLVGFALIAKRMMTVVNKTQEQIDALASDVRLRVGAVSDRVNAVADEVRGVTARVQQVATSVQDGVHQVEQTVRSTSQRVQSSMDQVPDGVKKGVPAGLAVLAALRTVQKVRSRMKENRVNEREAV